MTNSVKFKFMAAIVAISAMIVCTGCNKDNDENGDGNPTATEGLTINNLPSRPGQAYDVQIFQAGTDLSTYMSWMAAILNRKGLAMGSVGSQSSENTFSLNIWDGLSGNNTANKFKGNGTFPVILYDVNIGATTWHKITQITFTEGKATVNFSQFEGLW